MNGVKMAFALLALLGVAAFAQQKGSFTDARDKKTYKTVKIGKQTWMAENLGYEAESFMSEKQLGELNSKCYDNKPENCEKYGRLYNWEMAMKACPKGWHLPKSEEWDALSRYADGTSGTESPYSSKTAGKHLKTKEGWGDDGGESGNGTDKYGFAALPCGFVPPGYGFTGAGKYGYWWGASDASEGNAYGMSCRMSYRNENVDCSVGDDGGLFSVRCVKD